MTAWDWVIAVVGGWLVLAGLVALAWALVFRGRSRGDAEAIQDAPEPEPTAAVTEYLLEDLARAAGVLERGGAHEDLPLTVTQRLDLFRRAEDIYHHTSVPVIPGREEN